MINIIQLIYKAKSSILLIFKVIIVVGFIAAFTGIAYENYPFTKFFSINLGTSTSTYAALFMMFNYIYGGFKLGQNRISDVVYSINLSSIISLIFTYLQLCILFNSILNFIPIAVIMIANLGISFISAISFSSLYNKFYPPRKTVILYSSKTNVDQVIRKINSRPDKYLLQGSIFMSENLKTVFDTVSKCDLVLLCELELEYRRKVIDFCYKNNISVMFMPSVSDIIINKASFVQLSDTPILNCNFSELSIEQKIFKRIFDVCVGSLMLVIALPVLVITAIAIKVYDNGPIIYKQNRVTIGGKIFKLYKFRSMIIDAEKDGVARLASKGDDRITPIGKIIRMLRIDELPQIINILRGDLSIVGPRPERPEIIKKYLVEFPEFSYRLKVKAGMTGFAQIQGKYNTPPIDKLMMDLMYIESYSFLLDLKLVFMTIKILFLPESTEGV